MSLPPRKARPMDILLRASARTRRDELSLAIVLEAESAGSVRPAVVVAHVRMLSGRLEKKIPEA